MTRQSTTLTRQLAPSTSPLSSGLLQRKCACGQRTIAGGECEECQKKRSPLQRRSTDRQGLSAMQPIAEGQLGRMLQTKLQVNQPGDRYEQEADWVAEQVMQMSESVLQLQVQEEKEKELLQTKLLRQRGVSGREGGNEAPPIVHKVLQAPGQPLDPQTRAFMESRFGHDFSHVRVHTDAQAVASVEAVEARAYTVGHDVVFGAGQYTPYTNQGRRLLAHELTHVVQQRGDLTVTDSPLRRPGISERVFEAGGWRGRREHIHSPATFPRLRRSVPRVQRKNGGGKKGGAKPAKKNYSYSVTTLGCDKVPFSKADVEAAAKTAFTKVKNSNCVKTDSLKENILAEFNGLKIDCKQGTGGACGSTGRYFKQTVTLHTEALSGFRCPPLAATILHEVVHLTEWSPFGHGELAWACEMSCFGTGIGDASKCTYETGFVPVVGASGGVAFPSQGAHTWQARLYIGLEKRGPVLGFVHPSLGIGVGLVGEPRTEDPSAISTGTSTLVSLLGGLRLDPGKPGGGHISFFGGPAVAVGSGKRDIGAEAGAALGIRWRWLDFSVDAGIAYDPTREAGMDKLYTLGASIKIGPSVPRFSR